MTLLALCFALMPLFAQQPTAPPPDPPRPITEPQIAAPTSSHTAGLTSLGAAANYAGLPVRQVEFRGITADAKTLDHLRELVAQPLGAPLDRSKVRRSLQALYATGRFADLQVEADRSPQDEVTLVFVAKQNYFVGAVTVDGVPRRPNTNQLVNATKLQLGELFTDERVAAALRNVRSLLMENGYYNAVIEHQEQYHQDTQQVDIAFHLDVDGHAHIGDVTINGQPGYSPQEIEHIAGFQPGHTVTAQRVTKALQKLRKKYQKNDRLQAQVAITNRTYHPQSNTLDYVFTIDRGPTVDIHVVGAKISRGRLKKLVPIYEEGAIDDDLLNEGLRNLRDYFQTKGYFDVRVSWERQTLPGNTHVHVIYNLNLGMRHQLEAVQIAGNAAFPTELIRERMQIRPANGVLTTGVYSESMLVRDIQSIESLYRTNGYEHVKVDREVDDDYRGEKGHIMVRLRIEEGPLVKVGSVQLVGNHAFDTATLMEKMSTIPGQPFSEINIATDREVAMNYYFNHGFPNVQFDAKATPVAGNPDLRNVVYTVSEGDQVFVDRVLVSGLNFTRPYVVNRQLQVRVGDPLSQLGLLETQRRLYDLGIFNEVDMAVQNPDGQSKYKDLLFQLREAKRWTFNYGLGFQVQTGGQPADISQINTAPAPGVSVPPNTTPPTGGVPVGTNPQGGTGFSPDFIFEVTRLNFRGRDHTVSFKSRYGNLQKRALLDYNAPRFFDHENLRLTFSGFFENSRDVRTFTSERLEGSVQLEQTVSRITTLLWRYNYRRVKVDPNSLAISPALVPLLSKPVLLGMPSFTYIRDKRDDPLDTHKGNYTTFDLGVSARAFGSASVSGTSEQIATGGTQTLATAANFTRLVAQNSTYAPLFRGIIFARSTRIGVETPFGHNSSQLEIPLPERFFSGGATSHRGFALNQAGPRDLTTGFPLGGNANFVNNLELRLPPPYLPIVGQNVNFVLFHDFGNAFQSATQMLHSFSRWKQPDRSFCSQESTHDRCRFDFMSQALGLGLRYRTPIGPVRVDLSYNLNPPSFPYFVQCPATKSSTEVFPCSTLPPNGLFFQSATLRHFNFFFSIGQTF